MLLKDLMTRSVQDIPPQASLREAAERMRSLDVGALPVCDAEKFVGIITDRDITIRAVAQGHDPNQSRVSDVMTTPMVFCYEDDDVDKAAKLMEQRQIRRLPVFDHAQRLCGIISLGDIATRNSDDRLSGEVLEQVSEPAFPQA
jgi:CBS domain-containing protein